MFSELLVKIIFWIIIENIIMGIKEVFRVYFFNQKSLAKSFCTHSDYYSFKMYICWSVCYVFNTSV